MAGTGDLTLPFFTLSSTTLVADGDLTFPALTGTGTGILGAVGVVDEDFNFPSLVVSGEAVTGEMGTFEGSIPMVESSSATLYGAGGTGSLELSLFVMDSDGATGQYGTAAITLPSFEMDGGDAEAGTLAVDLPSLTLAGTGITGQAGQLSANLPNVTVSGTGVNEGDNVAALTFPALEVSGAGVHGSSGQGDCQISLFTIQGAGLSGEAGTADLTFPVFTITTAGGGSYSGTAAIILPSFILEATLETDVATSLAGGIVDITVYSMNLSNFGVSTFTNYPFNSYCLFNGSYLGAKADGIYLLSGAQDVTTSIDVEMLKEAIGQEVPNKKGIPVIYADLETDGQYDLTIKSEGQEQAYPGIPYHDGLRLQKIKVGRGIKGRYFGIGLKNRDGGAMRINSLEIPVEISSARKGR